MTAVLDIRDLDVTFPTLEGRVQAVRGALRPYGHVVVWSAGPDLAYLKRLGRAGFNAESVPVAAGKGHAQHTLFIGKAKR